MTGAEDRDAESVLAALVALVTTWSSVQTQGKIATALGIAISEGDVRGLYTLGANGAPMRIGHLADVLMITRPTMSKMVARLADAGFVHRVVSSDDARGALLSLTPAGDDAHRRLVAAGLEMVNAALDHTDDADTRGLAKLLRELIAQLPRS